jgi:hypothetical protein
MMTLMSADVAAAVSVPDVNSGYPITTAVDSQPEKNAPRHYGDAGGVERERRIGKRVRQATDRLNGDRVTPSRQPTEGCTVKTSCASTPAVIVMVPEVATQQACRTLEDQGPRQARFTVRP